LMSSPKRETDKYKPILGYPIAGAQSWTKKSEHNNKLPKIIKKA
jgi:hypothetical protein